jgi:hypothetical protein
MKLPNCEGQGIICLPLTQQSCRIMKLTMFLLVLGILQVSANEGLALKAVNPDDIIIRYAGDKSPSIQSGNNCNLTLAINKSTFYWVSLIFLLPFIINYYLKTIRKNKDLFWFIYKDGNRKFNYRFLKKIIVQLLLNYFAIFAFLNVIFFVLTGKWVSDSSFQTAKVFLIISAVLYIIDLMEKSDNILDE